MNLTLPTLYKGAGPGTHWHINNAMDLGFSCAGHTVHTRNAVINHITNYSHPSPYISVSSSFAVAESYATFGPGGTASKTNPGYVYQIDPLVSPQSFTTYCPVSELGQDHPLSHRHNGDQSLILKIAHGDSTEFGDLRALVFAVRDGELLVANIPAVTVINRVEVF